MAVMKKPKAPTLFDRIGTYFDARHANGREGLILLDECIQRTAKNRDWDALARFVSRAYMSGQDTKVKRIIRAAFGDRLVYKRDIKHAAGGVFEMKWEGSFPLKASNTYSVVTKAIENGKSWDDRDFQKAIGEVLPDPVKPAKIVTAGETEKVAKHVVAYIKKQIAEGFSSGEIMAEVQRLLAAETAKPGANGPAPVGAARRVYQDGNAAKIIEIEPAH